MYTCTKFFDHAHLLSVAIYLGPKSGGGLSPQSPPGVYTLASWGRSPTIIIKLIFRKEEECFLEVSSYLVVQWDLPTAIIIESVSLGSASLKCILF